MTLPPAVAGLLRSRKFLLAVIACAASLAGRLGWDLDAEALAPIVGPLWLALLGFALEDHGKGAAMAGANVAAPEVGADAPAAGA